MTHTRFDPGSFRDPDGRVFHHRGAICRTISPSRQAEITSLLRSNGFRSLVSSGLVLPTDIIRSSDAGLDVIKYGDHILQQNKIPFVSYPNEWSFAMLRGAALATLDIIGKALDWGYTLKDATPFNIVYEGSNPRFVDILSFVPHKPGTPWQSYGQFCRAFLYPLLIASYRQIDIRPWLLSQSNELTPREASRFFSAGDLRRPGIFKDIYLAAKLDSVSTTRAAKVSQQGLFALELIKSNVRRLRKIIISLEPPYGAGTEWSDYANNTSYSAAGVNEKKVFVTQILSSSRPSSVLDIGANTGVYSRIASKFASDKVMALDGDLGAIENLFNSLDPAERIYPIVADLAHPTPATGWALKERPSLLSRIKCDFFLALAVIHHLRISANVNFEMILDELAEIGNEGIIEWIEPNDPMCINLMALRDCRYPDFNFQKFSELLNERFTVLADMPLKDGMRRLIHVRRSQ